MRGCYRFATPAIAGCALMLAAFPAQAAIIRTLTTPVGALALIGAGAQQITFEDVRTGIYAGVGYPGIGFNTPAGTAMMIDGPQSGRFNTLGQSISNRNPVFGFTSLAFNFTTPASAFGFFFGGSTVDWTLTAFDGTGAPIETLVVPATGTSNRGDFFGIRTGGIASARLTQSAADPMIFVDNFTFTTAAASAVPEPVGWALLVTGFGVIGGLLRRRPRQRVRTSTYRV